MRNMSQPGKFRLTSRINLESNRALLFRLRFGIDRPVCLIDGTQNLLLTTLERFSGSSRYSFYGTDAALGGTHPSLHTADR